MVRSEIKTEYTCNSVLLLLLFNEVYCFFTRRVPFVLKCSVCVCVSLSLCLSLSVSLSLCRNKSHESRGANEVGMKGFGTCDFSEESRILRYCF